MGALSSVSLMHWLRTKEIHVATGRLNNSIEMLVLWGDEVSLGCEATGELIDSVSISASLPEPHDKYPGSSSLASSYDDDPTLVGSTVSEPNTVVNVSGTTSVVSMFNLTSTETVQAQC